MSEIKKAKCISDAQIQFVSLVNKAANKKSFLITKAEDGQASFSTFGKILKTDSENHYVTGIVYEPMVEDSQGDFMTADEIQKAAVWYAKNGSGVDMQHNFTKFDNAVVVESMVAKSDFTIEKEKIKKGTWLMTVEISDSDVWESIEKGEITGFSMGGVGTHGEEDIDLSDLSKSENKSVFKKLAKMLGFEVVEKGAFADDYNQKSKSTAFWDAFYSLENVLYSYNYNTDRASFETDGDKIKECLSEFSEVIQKILTADNVSVIKSEAALSDENLKKLTSVHENIGNLLKAEETEDEMTKDEIIKLVADEVEKAVAKALADAEKDGGGGENSETETVTKEETLKIVAETVAKALEPIYKSRGIPTNLNNETKPVQKEEDAFAGLFI